MGEINKQRKTVMQSKTSAQRFISQQCALSENNCDILGAIILLRISWIQVIEVNETNRKHWAVKMKLNYINEATMSIRSKVSSNYANY